MTLISEMPRTFSQHGEPSAAIFTFVDLFCGAGGFTEGFLLASSRAAAPKLVAASDSSPMVRLTYEGRFRDQLGINFGYVERDVRDPSFITDLVTEVERVAGIAKVDVVCGGPPCQGFSVFGARNRTDPRNDLFFPYLQAIERLEPKYFILENVPGLVKMYGGRAVESIREAVQAMGPAKYTLVGPLTLTAADYGVPQVRERIMFFGCREDMPVLDRVPPKVHSSDWVTVGDALGDLAFLRPWEKASHYAIEYPPATAYQVESRRGRLFETMEIPRTDVLLHNHEAARHTPDVIARFSMLQQGKGLESVPRELWDKHLRTAKKWCVRLDASRPSYTVVTLPDDLVHPSQPRILTVRELARLQSFDDTHVFRGPRATGGGGAGNKLRAVEVPQYSQVGNAVPPMMAKAVAEVVLSGLLAGPRARYIPVRTAASQRARQLDMGMPEDAASSLIYSGVPE